MLWLPTPGVMQHGAGGGEHHHHQPPLPWCQQSAVRWGAWGWVRCCWTA